jgi:hypothetical protein
LGILKNRSIQGKEEGRGCTMRNKNGRGPIEESIIHCKTTETTIITTEP